MKSNNHSTAIITQIFIIISLLVLLLLITCSSIVSASINSVDNNPSTNQLASVSESVIKVLIDDAIQALQNGNTTKTLENLHVIVQMISQGNKNSSYLQASELLINDAIDAVNKNNTSRASLYLNLTGQQFDTQNFDDQSVQLAIHENQDLLTYNNPVFGISIQYPRDWSIRQYEYNPAANNTLVGFYSSSKTASELGNISGVSGNFVPYMDIFAFGPKNVSLNDVVKERLDTINKSSNFIINESKSISLKGNYSAYRIVYSSMIQGEFFKKLHIYTSLNNKVYLITFTAQDALFSNYLETVGKMIDSFRENNSTSRY